MGAIPTPGQMREKGRTFVIAAPSGAGKTTLNRRLMSEHPCVELSVSYTTRARRVGETHGVDYWFISADEFKRKIADHEMVEWAEVHGSYYGTGCDEVERIRAKGHHVLLEIDVQGFHQIKAKVPDAVSIFIMPPSVDLLEKRLRGRGTDKLEVVERRLRVAKAELEEARFFDFFIVNDDLESAYADLAAIIIDGVAPKLDQKSGMEHRSHLIAEFNEKEKWNGSSKLD